MRLLDINDDGFMDVLIGNAGRSLTRLWNPEKQRWKEIPGPVVMGERPGSETNVAFSNETVRFGILRRGEEVSVVSYGSPRGAWTFTGESWKDDPALLAGLEIDPDEDRLREGQDCGLRFRDLDDDGCCEALVRNASVNAVYRWSPTAERWERLPFAFPEGVRIAGLRFLDLDEDGHEDLVYSGPRAFGIYLFDSMETGWSRRVMSGQRTPEESLALDAPLPTFLRLDEKTGDVSENGDWVHSRHLWWQNEDTASLPDLVNRRSFNDLLADTEPRAKSPEASLRSIRVRPGFQVELVAAEPLVMDPIAFDWGADGKLWVVEMGDYPLGKDGRNQPDGRVRFLEDVDQDGIYDTSTLFLDGLAYPTGIMPWRDGVLIACAPEILFAADRDGDGKAEVRDTLFRGFNEGNQQHRLNGFDLGLDGWVYGANGDSGGRIRSFANGNEVDIRGRDFRFRPDEGLFEAESGQTQYGRHRDDWGHWFGGNNSNWAWQYVLSDHDLRQNPGYAPPDTRTMIDTDGRLFPLSRTLARFNDLHAANHVTSANSPTPYRDELFGPEFPESLFISEPVHNLVHRVVLERDGPVLTGHRATDEVESEFLASSDNWFRPTMLRTGPDGALWIADMYRAVIEHPEWIPDDWEARLDLRAGHDRGRIYRVYPVNQKPRLIPRLDRLELQELVASLDSPNGWQRDTAQRLLLHKDDPNAIEPLRRLARESRHPKVRIQRSGHCVVSIP